jgi:hypothetical protein
MSRIGSKRNFMLESQQNEMQENDKLVAMNTKSEGGITTIDLILEPDKFDALGSECRLTLDEYCNVVNEFIEDEEKDWHELRMKDQINMTRDYILEATVLKYAKEHYNLDRKQFNGSDLNYVKRYDDQGRFLGEALVITLTLIPQMNATIK